MESSLALGSWRPFSPFASASRVSSRTLPSCSCPCCRMMSAPANQGVPGQSGRPGYWLPHSSLPTPHSVSAAVRCGIAAKAQVGEGNRRGRKKNTLHKKTPDNQTHQDASRHFARQQAEPERAAPAKRPEEKERNKRHTHKKVRQEKIPVDSAMVTRRLIAPPPPSDSKPRYSRLLCVQPASRSLHLGSLLPQQQLFRASNSLCPRCVWGTLVYGAAANCFSGHPIVAAPSRQRKSCQASFYLVSRVCALK